MRTGQDPEDGPRGAALRILLAHDDEEPASLAQLRREMNMRCGTYSSPEGCGRDTASVIPPPVLYGAALIGGLN